MLATLESRDRIVPIADCEALPVEVEIVAGANAFASLKEVWLALEDEADAATPFQSYAVASGCFDAHLKRNALPRIVVLKKNGKPALILPTVITPLFGLPVVRFLGDPLIQYGDCLADQRVTLADIEMALAAAADPQIACLALFRRVRDDARIAPALSHSTNILAMEESPLIDLRRPAVLASRHQRELRRQRRKLAERGAVQVRFFSGIEALSYLNEALRLKRLWIEAHGFESAVVGSPDWEEAIRDICTVEGSRLVAAVLFCGDTAAAVEIAFVDCKGWFGFIGAFAHEYAAMSPGQILAAECMQWARDQELATFDQLPPAQEYKQRYATDAIAVRDYAICLRRSGILPLTLLKSIPALKRLLPALPTDVRLRLIRMSGH